MKTPRKALEAYWDLPADLEVVGAARRLVREVLVAWGISAVAEDVTMVVSELVSNAVVHGKAPITLSLHRHGRIVCGRSPTTASCGRARFRQARIQNTVAGWRSSRPMPTGGESSPRRRARPSGSSAWSRDPDERPAVRPGHAR